MSIISRSSIIILVLALCLLATEAAGRLVGGRSEVKNVGSNEEVQELGRFALEEYKRTTALTGKEEKVKGLKFAEVVAAERQVVSGLKYYLKVAVMNEDGERRVYDSVVVVKPWQKKSKQLVGFKPSATSTTAAIVYLVRKSLL